MRIAITGASGFIGQALVEHIKTDHQLILLGRNPNLLKEQFPEHICLGYDALNEAFIGCDCVVHLAAALPMISQEKEIFQIANVELAISVANAALDASVPLLINTATLGWHHNHYTSTKIEAERKLNNYDLPRVVHLRLPAVYGSDFKRRLNILNKIPQPFRPLVFQLLCSLRPTVALDKVCKSITETIQGKNIESRIVSDSQLNNWFYKTFKVTLDYSFAAAVISLFWWLLILIWILVKTTSIGPGIFAQQRVGLNGKVFTCYKFRTMQLGTTEGATHETPKTSVTRVGHFLRSSKLDELPQIWNILRGELSLIGPRPCLPSQTTLIDKRHKQGVYRILPGITGLAQVQGIDMSDPAILTQKDAEYLALRCMPLDIKVLLRTFFGSGSGDRTIT